MGSLLKDFYVDSHAGCSLQDYFFVSKRDNIEFATSLAICAEKTQSSEAKFEAKMNT